MNISRLASAIAASVALASAGAVQAGDTPESEGLSPNLNLGEKLLITATEQHVSLLAAYVEHLSGTGGSGCSGNFSWAVRTDTAAGTATSTVDDHTLTATRVVDNFSGTWIATSDAPGEIGNTPVGELCVSPRAATMDGDFFYSDDGEIMYANSDFCLGIDEWDEHVVKDIFRDPEALVNELNQPVVHDRGIEVITKKRVEQVGETSVLVGWPRAKWRQTSRFVKANGATGEIQFRKVRVAPDGAPSCFISISADIDGDAAGFDSRAGNASLTSLEPNG